MSNYLSEYRRLTNPLLVGEDAPNVPGMTMGGPSDLTPLKNKAREAAEALNDAQRAADSGRSEDAMEALRRARSVIDAALGGAVSARSSAIPPSSNLGGGRF